MPRLIIKLLLLPLLALCAQGAYAHPREKAGKASEEQRRQWEAEFTKYKHDFFTKELNIPADKQTTFFALYDAMDRDRRQLFQKVKRARRTLDKKAAPTDAEYLEVVALDQETDRKVKELEWRYFAEFRKVLTPMQLYQLRPAEEKFMRSLRNHAKDARTKKGAKDEKSSKSAKSAKKSSK